MIAVRRPGPGTIEAYRAERLAVVPTCRAADVPPVGFRHQSVSRVVGTGRAAFERARLGIEQWAAHRGAGVEVFPSDSAVAQDETVALVTRQFGLWVLAACRIESVLETPMTFGFVYSTLPDHPECGYESFTINMTDDQVTFAIEAVSRPGVPIVRLGAPVTRHLQRKATNDYLAAMERWMQPARDRP